MKFTHYFTRALMMLLLMVSATMAWAQNSNDFIVASDSSHYHDDDDPNPPTNSIYTVTRGQGNAENSKERFDKLIDNNKNTKWCLDFSKWGTIYVQFKSNRPIIPTGYVLTTGNDNATNHGRNPKNWTIKARKNTDDDWTTIATVTDDQTLTDENTKDFEFALTNTEAYQYFYFEVTATRGSDIFQLSELQFIFKEDETEEHLITSYSATAGTTGANNNEGYAKLVDNIKTTKWCVDMNKNSSVFIEFQTEKAIVPTGYMMTTGNDNATNHDRNPKNWTIKAKKNSTDDWTTIATVTDDQTLTDENNKDFEFTLTNTEDYQYFRFDVTATRGSTVFQLSEFQFKGKVKDDGGSSALTTYSATAGTAGANNNEGYAKLVDNNKTTKWCVDTNKNPSVFIEFQTTKPIVPTGYVMTTGNDNATCTGRNPKNWTIKARKNTSDDWTTIVTVTDDQTLTDENTKDFEFTLTNTEAYQYFRFEVTALRGSTTFQLSEFQFKGTVKDDSGSQGGGDDDSDPWGNLTGGYCGKSSVNDGKNVYYDLTTDENDKEVLTIHKNPNAVGSDCSIADYEDPNSVDAHYAPWMIVQPSIGGVSIVCDGHYVVIEEGVTGIGKNAFKCCNYENFLIPASVTSIDAGSFLYCFSTTDVYCYADPDKLTWKEDKPDELFIQTPSKTTKFHVKSAHLATYKEKFGDFNVTFVGNLDNSGGGDDDELKDDSGTCGDGVTYSFEASTKTLTISGTGAMDDYDYENKSPWSSYGNDIETLVVEDGVTSIGEDAFYDCDKLTTATIGSSVKSIGQNAFRDCDNLATINGCEGVTHLGNGAFSDTAWYDNLPDGLHYVGHVAYDYIGDMPANTSIKINPGTIEIAACCFDDQSGLVAVTIPSSVVTIGEDAFSYCKGLTSITIPSSVKTIVDEAFMGCDKLETIEGCAGVTSVEYDAFYGTKWYNDQEDGLVYLGSIAYKYKGEMPEDTEITLKNGTMVIASGCFVSLSNLVSVTIPNSVVSINSSAFDECTKLENITIPNSVTTIGDEAFSDCSDMKTVTIGSGVTYIGEDAFYGCTFLKNVFCYADPDKLTWIDGKCDDFVTDSPSFIGWGTQCHVYDADAYKAKWATGNKMTDVNVTFVGDLKNYDTVKGDVDGNSSVNSADVVAIYNYILIGEESGIKEAAADVDGNGSVNSADIVAVYNIIIGI